MKIRKAAIAHRMTSIERYPVSHRSNTVIPPTCENERAMKNTRQIIQPASLLVRNAMSVATNSISISSEWVAKIIIELPMDSKELSNVMKSVNPMQAAGAMSLYMKTGSFFGGRMKMTKVITNMIHAASNNERSVNSWKSDCPI